MRNGGSCLPWVYCLHNSTRNLHTDIAIFNAIYEAILISLKLLVYNYKVELIPDII